MNPDICILFIETVSDVRIFRVEFAVEPNGLIRGDVLLFTRQTLQYIPEAFWVGTPIQVIDE